MWAFVHRSGEKTPTMFGGSVMCIVDRTIIRSIWKLRMGLCSMHCEYKVPPLRGNLLGNFWELWSKAPEQGEKFLLSGDQGWSIVVDRGGRPGKSRLWNVQG